MLLVCCPEPSEYLFPLVPRAAASDLPDIIHTAAKSTQKKVTPKLASHSLRRGAAAYANGCSKLAVQCIPTRGAWLLDSLTKAFAYVGNTRRPVGTVLAGYRDPDMSVWTPMLARPGQSR
ncbi:TPA: hypothetical protein N0F65_007299 [Lagenidium giganteum]|uniref:Uncharacterized protein n=1 Tax=Lagenidium giganteum TaxID=4803 RepID=A0AAV2Z404_9STRA|nr:TPA: hypothetical protein N0F65_007299 [Lagenidium giganteum]